MLGAGANTTFLSNGRVRVVQLRVELGLSKQQPSDRVMQWGRGECALSVTVLDMLLRE